MYCKPNILDLASFITIPCPKLSDHRIVAFKLLSLLDSAPDLTWNNNTELYAHPLVVQDIKSLILEAKLMHSAPADIWQYIKSRLSWVLSFHQHPGLKQTILLHDHLKTNNVHPLFQAKLSAHIEALEVKHEEHIKVRSGFWRDDSDVLSTKLSAAIKVKTAQYVSGPIMHPTTKVMGCSKHHMTTAYNDFYCKLYTAAPSSSTNHQFLLRYWNADPDWDWPSSMDAKTLRTFILTLPSSRP